MSFKSRFFSLKDYLKSWSVWVLGLVTVAPVLNDQTGIISALVPADKQDVAISILGAIGLIARAIRQTK